MLLRVAVLEMLSRDAVERYCLEMLFRDAVERCCSQMLLRDALERCCSRILFALQGDLGNWAGRIGWPHAGESAEALPTTHPLKKLSKNPSRQSLVREL